MSVSLTFSIPGPDAQAFKDRIQKEATAQGMSMSEYIVESIAEHLRNQKEPS